MPFSHIPLLVFPSPQVTKNLLSVSTHEPILDVLYTTGNRIPWLLPLSKVFPRLVQVVACVGTSFLYMAICYPSIVLALGMSPDLGLKKKCSQRVRH